MSEHVQLPGGGHQPSEGALGGRTPPAQGEEHERTPGVLHESEAFDFRLIVWVGVGLAVTGILVQIVVWGVLGGLEKKHTVPSAAVSELAKEDAERPLGQRVDHMPAPHLEGIERESSPGSIAAARQRAEVQLKNYGWIDRAKGIVHVPIDKAIEEVLRTKEFGSPNNKKKPAGGKR
jgi:hypothetical protein